MKNRDVHDAVKKAYGKAAKGSSCCCSKPCCGGSSDHPVPEAELGLSCGNPVAFTQLKEGDVVLDLGSGAGKDVFLAAMKVGPKGKAIGVDMTREMLELASSNARKFHESTGLQNVEFLEGQIEKLPMDDACVDVVISNCVINLSPDKAAVFREVYRVLKPGGRMVVSDIVLEKPLPADVQDDQDLYVACIAGALAREDYLRAISDAGFGTIKILADICYADGSGKLAAGSAASITVMAAK